MGRHNNESGALLHSSIALLQERFRELQRIREMREKRELNRLFSEAKCLSSSPSSQPRWFYHPELWNPSKPSKVYEKEGEGSEFQDMGNSLSKRFCPDERVMKKCIEAEIDTSLHL
ncbi:hypothetical protein MA16_Dca012624 [Dendrobium catenatum]|uniref:Uncharacterized protein n=1 Tax=Dendrobium catenatum TaxID=906689 RepID=A0A2I0VMY2_9ASPA|nr:hypothetical protein MA16_Dca012624 [Dendrobium catenatum]